MPESEPENHTLAYLRRLDAKLDRVMGEIADFRADMEVMAAIIRRMDGTMQGLVGEVRSLTAQRDRQRQKLDQLRQRVDKLEEPTLPA
jgi:predicted  nucleic acid-binding Zn-ribbon protein